MENVIHIEHLSKKYKTQNEYAVADISFDVMQGEIVGILGPNGAGKSTLIKMILGVVKPTDGKVLLLEKNAMRISNIEKEKIGVYLGGKSNLIFHLQVRDSLNLFRTVYKIPAEKFEENLSYYSKILQCESILDQRVATLSLGQKLRAEILCILIHEPKVLILDEPTLGLDIEGKRQIREMLRILAVEKKISVLITTHDVNDMEKLCSKILMICKGKKVLECYNDEFREVLQKWVVLTYSKCIAEQNMIEHDKDGYRYLVKKEDEEEWRSRYKNCEWIKTDMPHLEDLLYEYYR